jgi:hypothetical protein
MLVPPPARSWQAEPSLSWVRFSDATDWVAYHPLAGTVHCLTDAAHELWVIASARPHSTDEFVAALGTRFEGIDVGDLEQIVSDTLASMDRAGMMFAARP